MTANAQKLLATALGLPTKERAQLAEQLLASLNISREELDRLWAQEADSRIGAYESGDIKTLPAQKIFENIS